MAQDAHFLPVRAGVGSYQGREGAASSVCATLLDCPMVDVHRRSRPNCNVSMETNGRFASLRASCFSGRPEEGAASVGALFLCSRQTWRPIYC